MKSKYECIQIAPALYEVRGPEGAKTLTGYEVTAILDYFREQGWESQVREAIELHPEYEIDDEDAFVEECMDEIRSKYEIYGEFNRDIEGIVIDHYMYKEE